MKKIILLSHVSKNEDEKLLGFFPYDNLDNIIDDYRKLPGFSDAAGHFKCTLTIETDKEILWLLQIWDINTEYIYLEKAFENKDEVNKYLASVTIPKEYEITVEDYLIGERFWTDGFEIL